MKSSLKKYRTLTKLLVETSTVNNSPQVHPSPRRSISNASGLLTTGFRATVPADPLDGTCGITDIIAHLMRDQPSLLVFGGMNPMVGSSFTAEAASQVLQFFPGHLENWWGVARLPEPRVHFAAVYFKGAVYITG